MVLFLAVPPLWEEPPTAFSAAISHPGSVVEDVCLSLWQMFRLYCTCTIVICHCFSHQLLVNLLPAVTTTLQSILHWFFNFIFFFLNWRVWMYKNCKTREQKWQSFISKSHNYQLHLLMYIVLMHKRLLCNARKIYFFSSIFAAKHISLTVPSWQTTHNIDLLTEWAVPS